MSQPPVQLALLRGINVGGHNKLPMRELVRIFESLGCTDVRTYIQSGNVLYRADRTLAKGLPSMATEAIRKDLGLEVPVVTRSATQWRRLVGANPFVAAGVETSELALGLMREKPSAKAVALLDPDRSPTDSFELRGAELYLHFPDGVARTKLTNAYFDSRLKTVTTVRNWKTTLKLLELADA
ncbi:MAG: hypothetical protein ACI8QZ_003488 [Chlamydiales bacterium]|jgi:uncharacterized protein (DUF1697 family)